MKTLKSELPHWLILAVPFIYLTIVYAGLPDIVPTHFDVNGTPNDYRHKTSLLWATPLLTIVIYALMLFVSRIKSQQLFTASPKIIYSLRLFLTVIFSSIACSTIYISQPAANLQMGTYLILALVILLIAGIILCIYLLYKKAGTVLPEEVRNAYKWGMFYYNPNDKRLWVPKLSGLGWTLNFASPLSYLILAAFIGFLIWSLSR